ncbi:glycosyltransferase family 2 protein [Collinsella ihumii]|uniref:Glycosyltransferase family A protein n=1 Tax=Collinsella ihumii TaxID=1720204 RepID=A0AAW7JZ67_9ACTN|nr:glycosyltransferase family A protein [Collinsella ihumii]MDN0069800.1 glycosyltransferase family A protein [Collinsella ihumii]
MTHSNIALSIIVPAYNIEKYIGRCIESLTSCANEAFEIILVDDGSSDRTGEICRYYAQMDHRIIYHYQNNSGVSTARNAGIEKSRGSYVWFCDGDDWVETGSVDMILSAIDESMPSIIAFAENRVDQDGGILGVTNAPKLIDGKRVLPLQCDDSLYPHCHVFSRRLIGSDVRFDTSLALLEDCDFVYRLFLRGGDHVVTIEKPLYNYWVTRRDSASNIQTPVKMLGALRVVKSMYETERRQGRLHPAYESFVRFSLWTLSVVGRAEGVSQSYRSVRNQLVGAKEDEINLGFPLRCKAILAVHAPHLYIFACKVWDALKQVKRIDAV